MIRAKHAQPTGVTASFGTFLVGLQSDSRKTRAAHGRHSEFRLVFGGNFAYDSAAEPAGVSQLQTCWAKEGRKEGFRRNRSTAGAQAALSEVMGRAIRAKDGVVIGFVDFLNSPEARRR